jgi:DNA polymerase I
MTYIDDIGIISGRYHSVEANTDAGTSESTVLELFGRSKSGESVCLLVSGLNPSFEITPLSAWSEELGVSDFILQRIKEVEAMKDVVGVSGPVMKLTDLGVRPIWSVTVRQPFLVPNLRKMLSKQSWQIYSGDIPFLNRLFLDYDLRMHMSVEGTVVDRRNEPNENLERTHAVVQAGGSGRYSVDVTVACNVSQLKDCEPFPVPFKVFSFDLETSIEHETILCAAAWVEDMGTGTRQSYSFKGKESSIMENLTLIVRSMDPDIITGYNIDNFDLPRMYDRMQAQTKSKQWRKKAQLFGWGRVEQSESESKRNRSGLFPRRQSTRAWNVAGRSVVDAWWQARMALRPQRETLSFISNLLFPEDKEKHKMDVDASKMDMEWANRPDEVMEYCIRDAALPLDILNALQVIRRKEAVAAVAKVTFDTAAIGSTSQLVDSLVIRLADSENVAVPLTGSAEAKEGQITGGYVHEVDAGLHPWIAVLDFKSMYPSIMIGQNICYTTRIDPAQPDQPADDEPVYTAPTGARFRHQSVRKGLVPRLLEDLMAQRDVHKAALKAAKQEGNVQQESFHDSMQYAVKILMNTFYGVFASGFYRFTHRDLGSSITAWARHNIKAIIAQLEEEGHGVVYSDTDSIFVRSPVDESAPSSLREEEITAAQNGEKAAVAKMKEWNIAKQSMIDFGLEIAERYSRDSAVLEFEKGLSVFFSHGAKKRYVGQVVWPSEEMLIRGYETQRTDSFNYLTSTMKRMFSHALADEGDELVKYALARVQAVKKAEIDASELILAKSCKGRVSSNGDIDFTKDYANPDSMAQVRVAKARIALGLGFTSGMKVSYIVTDASQRPMRVEPWLENEENGGISAYDGQFYAERLAAALGRITEAFGWTAKELVSGNKQTTLFSF